MKSDTAQDKSMIKKAFKQHDTQKHAGGSYIGGGTGQGSCAAFLH